MADPFGKAELRGRVLPGQNRMREGEAQHCLVGESKRHHNRRSALGACEPHVQSYGFPRAASWLKGRGMQRRIQVMVAADQIEPMDCANEPFRQHRWVQSP
jgi:hypothetical protein